MAQTTVTINQIFSGQSATQYYGADGTYMNSVAIDPDLPISSSASDFRTSGFAVPVGSSTFSGGAVSAAVLRLINNPKNSLTYAVTTDGKLISYSSSFGSETTIGTVTGGVATWAEYYNNYIYIFTGTDVSRYGPLNGTPALTNTVWTGATLGTQTALTNTTYPSLRGVTLPNHVAHVHGDNNLYFADFKDGQGIIHRISTKKVTHEGDTNGTVVASAYNVLDLPIGFYPTAIESFGTSLMIVGIYTTDTTINQGKSAFVLWDPTDTVSFFLGPVSLPDPLATAALNVGGIIYLWTGNAVNGCRLSTYTGGTSVQDVIYQEEGMPPFPGAVDALGNRVVWGGFTTAPNASGGTLNAAVWAYGSKDARLPAGLHNVMRPGTAVSQICVTALKYIQQSSNVTPKVIAAWNTASTRGIDQYSSSATLTSVLRFMINTGNQFDVRQVKIPLAGVVDSNTTIGVKLYQDDYFGTSKTLATINDTNYSGKRKVVYSGTELKDTLCFNSTILELSWTGTNPLPVAFPITMVIDEKEDEKDA